MYYYLYLPGIIILSVPVVCAILQSILKECQRRGRERSRRIASEQKAIRSAEHAAKKEEAPASAEKPAPRRKRGRPRKNPERQQAEIILNDPDLKTNQPAPLPTSCTPDQFAAWIEKIK